MTVSSPVNSVTYTGNNATTVFSYAFEIRVAENARVILTDISDADNPIATELVPAQYTITGLGDENGGTVTYPIVGSPIDTDTRITIQSIEEFTQEVDLVNQDGFYPSVVETALDKLTRLCQQLDEQMGRAVLTPVGATETLDLSELISAINIAAAALSGAVGVLTPCTATGTNSIALTPVSGGAHSSYVNQELFSFVAANTTSGVVTANVSGLGAKKVYLETGVQASTGDIISGVLYLMSYVAALDSANGGFYIFGTGTITLARFPSQAEATILGRASGAGAGLPIALTAAQVRAIIGYLQTAPTVQTFTSGSGTYTTPAGVKWIRVRLVGGGGGGSGSGTASGGNGGTGGNTTFDTLAGNGGSGGAYVAAGGTGGAGGTAANGSINANGSNGNNAQSGGVNSNPGGAGGGSGFFGGGGMGAGTGGKTNTGGGGQGGAGNATVNAGGGGGAGACVEKIITAPAATYAYAVGAGGAAGTAGTSGAAGAAGAAGFIIVEEFYNY